MQQYLPQIHMVAVIVFLLIYLVKTPLLLMNKMETLDRVRKATKVPEMIVSFLFLLTGVWMLVQLPVINTLLIVKIAVVLASIPIAIIGFKKKNKALALIALLMVIGAYGLAEVSKKKRIQGGEIVTEPTASKEDMGANIYAQRCINCHGAKGDAKFNGAYDLSVTTLGTEEIKNIIHNGKEAMPPNPDLSEDQLDAVTEYVKTLKK
jgi:mono/diheme cytochrome c family protein